MDFGTFEEELAMKSYIVSLLVKQAVADEKITYEEKSYLNYVAKSLHLEESEIHHIIQSPDSFNISPPPDEDTRLTILYYLLFMMRADQDIDIKEEELCFKIGFQMGFREEMVTDLINVMKEYLAEEIPPQAMLNKITRYLN